MPCSMTDAEIRYYETRHNNERYGLEWTNTRLVTAVACAMGRKLEETGELQNMPLYVRLWFEDHKKNDEDARAIRNEPDPGRSGSAV